MTPPFKPLPDHLDHPAGSAGAVLQIAASQIGYREAYNNDNAFGVWYPMNHQPWCAMFVSWAAWQAGVDQSIIPKHAYTPSGAAWFRARGRLHTEPQAGDVGYVYYSSMGRIGHVFLVEKVWRTAGGALLMNTIEGNTNDTGSSQGNGVYRLVRADTTNLSYGRPAYAAEGHTGEGDDHELINLEDDVILVQVREGEEIAIPVSGETVVEVAAVRDTVAEITGWGSDGKPYKLLGWEGHYDGANRIGVLAGSGHIGSARLTDGTTRLVVKQVTGGPMSVRLQKAA